MNTALRVDADFYSRLVETRREFAMYPELSGEEIRTARVVAGRLRELDMEVWTDVGGHGVVGLLRGGRPGPLVALRCELDAMPIPDVLQTPYSSLQLGVKHACGHDAHLAMLLGAAEALAARRAQLPGAVRFIFQPEEESLAGALAMLEAGVLDDPRPAALFGVHVFPLPVGQVGYTPGLCLPGMDEFMVTFNAPPPSTRLKALCAEIAALSTLPEPKTPEDYAAVIRAQTEGPLLPPVTLVRAWPYPTETGEPQLLGLATTPDPERRAAARAAVEAVLARACGAMSIPYRLEYTFYNPPLVNDAALVARTLPALREAVGDTVAFRGPYPFAHEDFARYAQLAPAALYWVGAANPARGIHVLHHTEDFDIDEACLPVGVRVLVALVAAVLEREG